MWVLIQKIMNLEVSNWEFCWETAIFGWVIPVFTPCCQGFIADAVLQHSPNGA
ncbi:MAG: hypothetical protein RJB20_1050 [Pseudomonadota bacterium]|jgi:hypothetical protein